MREAFVARPGCVLVSADYSQIEMRLMAHFSRDAPLIAALQAGQDIFTARAARLFGVAAPAEVKDAQRAQAKAVSYAILYGAGPGLLVQNLAISIDDARRLIAAWHRAYPRVQELIEERLHAARLVGFVETLGGRKRFLPHIKASGRAERARAERQVVNTLAVLTMAIL